MALRLDIVTPAGSRLHEEAVDCVVVRRLEAAHDPGAEQVAIYPRHGAPADADAGRDCSLQAWRGERASFTVGYGVLEVYRDHVTIVER